jgi:3-hydroxyisobutyrate dehydrogenase
MTVSDPASAPARPRVAVLGTGTMGAGMARSLLRAGLAVDIWNRTPERSAGLAGQGATGHASPAAAVAAADVVITMLADAAAVRGVALGQGMLGALRPGAVWAQMATIGVQATSDLAAAAARQRPDVAFVDAPVSGSRAPAESGELLILASGPDRARPVLEPVFSAIGQATRWLGPAGAGSRMKIVVNAWLIFLIEGAAEVMALAGALGVDQAAVLGLLSSGRLAAPAAAGKARKMAAGDDSPDFSLQWATKDAGLALDAADGLGLAGLAAIRDRWQALVDSGLGGLDTSAARHGLGQVAAAAR